MKKTLLATFTISLALAGAALAAGITDIPWNETNIERLRTFDDAAVSSFVNHAQSGWATDIVPARVGEFSWADLSGDRHYHLVVTVDFSGRGFLNTLMIYTRDPSGNATSQEIKGWEIRDLGKVVRDLDGDGRDELVIPTILVEYSTAATYTWPVVYRFENGQYKEASRDFPGFYDGEVLPKLERDIAQTRRKAAEATVAESPTEQQKNFLHELAISVMERNQILRAIGRDPTAGLQDAREWMTSDDQYLLQDAAATFQSIGGHEEEMRAASNALQRARARDRASAR